MESNRQWGKGSDRISDTRPRRLRHTSHHTGPATQQNSDVNLHDYVWEVYGTPLRTRIFISGGLNELDYRTIVLLNVGAAP